MWKVINNLSEKYLLRLWKMSIQHKPVKFLTHLKESTAKLSIKKIAIYYTRPKDSNTSKNV